MATSIRDKVAGLIVLRLGSNMVPPRTAEEDAQAVTALLDRRPFGGLILFNGRWPETRQTLLNLQQKSDLGLLVMTDMERGLGQQIAGATVFPHLRAFGELGDEGEAAVRDFGRIGAEEALACGVHVAFAPVADVSRNPQNPIISTRAFGEDTQTVERLVRVYIEAARETGLLTTAKHFPGHSNTHEDSHAVTPVVHDSFEELSTRDLPPFRAAVDAGVDLMMTAHASYPALDASGNPATRSHPILHDLLRNWLGFDGAVITDSLHMGGIHDPNQTEADVAVDMLDAGVDLFLDLRNPEAVVEGVARAVEEGRLEEATLDMSLARAERLRKRLRARFGENLFTDPSLAFSPDVVGTEKHQAVARRIAQDAIKVLEGAVPELGTGEGLLALLIDPAATDGGTEASFENALAEHFPEAAFQRVEDEATSSEDIRSAVQTAERLLVAVVVKPSAWRRFGLSDEQRAFVQDLIHQKPAVLAALGSPRGLNGFTGAEAQLCTYSDVPASRVALIEFLTTPST